MKYQLWTENWIPVVTTAGSEECSLREVLGRAHQISHLQQDNPLIEVALFRLLMAIVLDMRATHDSEWKKQWDLACFDPVEIDHYAHQVEDRFDLLDPVKPFYQVADLTTPSGEVKSTLLLYPEIASGNNVPVFSSVTEATPPKLFLAEAARRLIALQGMDVAGIKSGAVGDPTMAAGKTTGNPTGVLGRLGLTIPLGSNLFQSLMLNIPPYPLRQGDDPVWRRSPVGAAWETRPARGLLDELTWQSRRVRLVPDPTDPSFITGVIVAAGDRLEAIDPGIEPHTAWHAADPSRRQMSQRPIRHQPGKAAWRGMDSLLAGHEPDELAAKALSLQWIGDREAVLGPDYPVNVRTVGIIYGNQNAVIDHVISDEIPLPVLSLSDSAEGQELRDNLIAMADKADEVRKSLNGLLNNLRKSCGGAPVPWDKGEHPGDEFISAIDQATRAFLTRVSAHPDQLLDADLCWQLQAWQAAFHIADRLLSAAPPMTFIGRSDNPDKSGDQPINQARAEGFFRAGLKKILSNAYDEITKERRKND